MAASVVRVQKNSMFTGTGFVCYSGDDGRCLVMTVADAVGRSKRTRGTYTVGLPDQRRGAVIEAQLLHVDRNANLALLSFVPGPQHQCPALPFADRMAQVNSGPVVVRGYYFMGHGQILQAPGVFRGAIRFNYNCSGSKNLINY